MKPTFLLILALTATTLLAQSDPEHPAALQSNVLEATTHGEGGNVYYELSAGPGEVIFSVQASTDDYSSPVELELLSDGKSIGSINVVATDSAGRASRTFQLPIREDIVLRITTRADSHVKWLKYRVSLKGAVDLNPQHAVGDATPTATAPMPDADTLPPAPPVSMDAPAPTPPSNADLSLDTFAELLASAPTLPSSGTLRIDMKDGSYRLVPLSQVLRLSVVRSK